MFVSHQWLAASHPDPQCRQLKVLQDTLHNVLSGACKIVKLVVKDLHMFITRLRTLCVYIYGDGV